MLNSLRYTRPLNLGMIALVMSLMKFSIIEPALERLTKMTGIEFESQMSIWAFMLLILSVVCVAAGGYLLNDTLDVERDQINNKSKKLTEGDEKSANYLLVAGVALGLGLGYYLGNVYLGLIHVFAASTLYVYNISLKNSPGFGNIMVAFLAGLVPLTVGLFEVPLLNKFYASTVEQFQGLSFNFIGFWIIGFSGFAFILTLAREIIKDLEDYAGDRQTGANTLPIFLGVTPTKITVTLVYVASMYAIWHVYSNYLPDTFTLYYCLLLIALIAVSVVLTWTSNSADKHHRNATLNKVISLIGLAYAIVFQVMMNQGTFII